MSATASPKTCPTAGRINRILALHPKAERDIVSEPVMSTEDPVVLLNVANTVRLWAHDNGSLPHDLGVKMQIKEVSRQPLLYVSVELESVTRTAVAVDEPFPPGIPLDESQWPSDDPFRLYPVAEPSFPAAPRTERVGIAGRQEVHVCTACAGAGASECAGCGAAGKVSCPACSGTHQIMCPRCNGTGSHIGVSGRMIQCQNCRTRGTVACARCGTNGQVNCEACRGRGQIHCQPCDGHGNIRTRWDLHINTTTRRSHAPVLKEPWPLPLDDLVRDTDMVAESVAVSPQDAASVPLDDQTFATVREQARSAIEASLFELAEADPVHHRVTGVRVRLLAAYAYDVRFAYGNTDCHLYLAGTASRVVPVKVPERRTGPIRAVGRLLGRYFHALGSDTPVGLVTEYVLAVKGGRAHVADSYCVLPAVAKALNCKSEVTPEGYDVYVVDEQAGEVPLPVLFNISIDVDGSGQLVISATHRLGTAHRNKLPLALSLCHGLVFGRLGIREELREDALTLSDCRPYDFAYAERYAVVLRAMAASARRIRAAGVLD